MMKSWSNCRSVSIFCFLMVFLVSCSQSSGSGSESGTHQTQKSVKSKNVIKSDNDSGQSGENENGSIGLNASEGSSDGSGAQVRNVQYQEFNIYLISWLPHKWEDQMIVLIMCTTYKWWKRLINQL